MTDGLARRGPGRPNKAGYRCKACRHSRPGCKGASYRKHGCLGARVKRGRGGQWVPS